jgi:hypothetical protein
LNFTLERSVRGTELIESVIRTKLRNLNFL